MKSLFKVTLLATTMALVLNTAQVMAKEKTADTTAPVAAAAKPAADSRFSSEEQKVSYALGASLGRYMENSLKEQEKLGVKMDRDALLQGVQEAYADKSKLNEEEIEASLQAFGERMKKIVQQKTEQEAKENLDKGVTFREQFAKESGVKKTKTGLLYKIEKDGAGNALLDTDTVVVNYKGALINGTEFDNSYTRGEPLSFRLDGVIPGWTEGLKHIRKGGKIKLVVPPQLAYGESGVPGNIPPNSTLVFDVELLDVKAAPAEKKADKKATDTKVQKK